ncbi:agmatinase [Halorubrum sp. E3]|uniref:Agmatinase n=1 Tax=Halorubrum persicum TaxID=1383844 RepID=A0A2G1WGQ4_9EURY|nr:agmatinase [Halorubrum sp. E3]PHQ38161.1 agmatinase [Halorubrum persicum]
MKSRAKEIVEIIHSPGDDRSRELTDQQARTVCVQELADHDAFDVTADTLRRDLDTLAEHGYLDTNTTGRPYWYSIADSWASSTTTGVAVDTSGVESQHSDLDGPTAADEADHADSADPVKNYQRVLTLFTAAYANLTSAQQTAASLFGIGGVVFGLLGATLVVSGLSVDPQLAAVSGSSLRAGVTSLFGWALLHLVGLVNAVSEDDIMLSSPASTSGSGTHD